MDTSSSSSSSSEIMFVSDLVKHNISLANGDLTLTVKLSPEGRAFIICKSPNNEDLLVDKELLLVAIEAASNWIAENFASGDPTNSWGLIMRGGASYDTHRLTLVFSLHDNVPTIDVREWYRVDKLGVFRPSSAGFTIAHPTNIVAFTKMKKPLEDHCENIDMLNQCLNLAHRIIFDMYIEMYGKSYNKIFPVIEAVNIRKFVCDWRKYVESDLRIQNNFSPLDICSFAVSAGLEGLEHYIKRAIVQSDSYIKPLV